MDEDLKDIATIDQGEEQALPEGGEAAPIPRIPRWTEDILQNAKFQQAPPEVKQKIAANYFKNYVMKSSSFDPAKGDVVRARLFKSAGIDDPEEGFVRRTARKMTVGGVPPEATAGAPDSPENIPDYAKSKGLFDRTARAFMTDTSDIMKDLVKLTSYGAPSSPDAQMLLKAGIQEITKKLDAQNAQWEKAYVASNPHPSVIEKVAGDIAGGAVPGVAHFMIFNPGVAGALSAADAKSKGENEATAFAKGAGERLFMGWALKYMNALKKPLSMAAQTGLFTGQELLSERAMKADLEKDLASQGITPDRPEYKEAMDNLQEQFKTGRAEAIGTGLAFGAMGGRPSGINWRGKIDAIRARYKQRTAPETAPVSPSEAQAVSPEAEASAPLVPSAKAQEMAQKPLGTEAEPIRGDELTTGDVFTRGGQRHEVKSVNPDGSAIIANEKGETLKLQEKQDLNVDKGSFKSAWSIEQEALGNAQAKQSDESRQIEMQRLDELAKQAEDELTRGPREAAKGKDYAQWMASEMEQDTSPKDTTKVEVPRGTSSESTMVDNKAGQGTIPPVPSPQQPPVTTPGAHLPISQGIESNAPTQKSLANRSGMNIEFLRNVVESKAFREKGLSGLNIPTQRLVKKSMVSAIHDPEIRDAVIKTVPIDVVNNLINSKSPADIFFHDKSVLSNPSSVNRSGSVSIRTDIADSIVRTLASTVTKRMSILPKVESLPFEKDSAVSTRNIRHEENIPQISHRIKPIAEQALRQRFEADKSRALKGREITPEQKSAIEQGGGTPYAFDRETNQVYFHEPIDKSTLQLPADQVTPEAVKAKIDAYAEKKSSIGAQELYSFPGPIGKQIEGLLDHIYQSPHHPITEGILRGIAPGAISPEHLQAANLVRSVIGESNHMSEVRGNLLEYGQLAFDKLGVTNKDIPLNENLGIRLMSALSTDRPGGSQFPAELAGNKAVQEYIVIRDKEYTKLIDAIHKEDPNALKSIRDEYFPGMWKDKSRRAFNQAMSEFMQQNPGKNAEDLNNWSPQDKAAVKARVQELMKDKKGSDDNTALSFLSKRTVLGKKSFLKEKEFDDIMTGVDFGLEPVSPNPVQLDRLKMAEMQRFLDGRKLKNRLKEEGLTQFWHVYKGKAPEGWETIDDPAFKVYGPPEIAKSFKSFAESNPEIKSIVEQNPDLAKEKGTVAVGGFPLIGNWLVKKEAADIVKNHLSQSLYNSKIWGPAYKTFMKAGNELNNFQLAGFFHAGFTTVDTIISANANILKTLVNVAGGTAKLSDLGGDFKDLKTAMTLRTSKDGGEILKAWLDPDHPASQRIKNIVRALELAGAGTKMEDILRTDDISKAVSDWYGGDKAKAALRSPLMLSEATSKPVLQILVPRQKVAVFGNLVDRIIRDNPGKTLDELAPQFNQAWNRTDSRLGQVRYDRTFMDRTQKNLLQMIMRAPGWTGGTIVEIGGGVKDTGNFLYQWQKTGKMPPMTDRMAYTASLAITTGLINAALQYAFVGIHNMDHPEDKQDPYPTSWKDFIAFRTGGKDDRGRENRFWIPSYMKDVYAWSTHPLKTAANKVNPTISFGVDLYRNQDYYGNQIYDANESLGQNALDVAKFAGKQFVPFSVRAMQQQAQTNEPIGERLAPIVGITPAPKNLVNTKAENMMDELRRGKLAQAGISKDQMARIQGIRDLRQDYKTGKLPTLNDVMKESDKKGIVLNKKQLTDMMMMKETGPESEEYQRKKMTRHLSENEMLKVFKIMTKEEKNKYRDIILSKIKNSKSMTVDEKVKAYDLVTTNDENAVRYTPRTEKSQLLNELTGVTQ